MSEKELIRIERSRKYFTGADLDTLLEEITVQEIDGREIGTPCVDGWFGVANEEGIFAYFGDENEAFKYRLDYINRILNC
jgi:hypothetical protein